MSSKLIIDCGKCILRSLKYSDAESIAKNANDFAIWKNVTDSFPHPYNASDAIGFIQYADKVEPRKHFAIVVDNNAVGVISINRNKNNFKIRAEIGYWLGKNYWNKGIMTASIKGILEYGFNSLLLEKIEAYTFDYNLASQKVLLKSGFREVCFLENHAIKEGEIVGMKYFAILKKYYK